MASIRKRTWQSRTGPKTAWVVDYADQHGKRRLKTFARKKEADAYLMLAGHEVRRGIHTPDSVSTTIAKAAHAFIKRCEQGAGRRGGELEQSTIRQYKQHVNLHIVPRVESEKLSKLNGPRVQALADQLVAELSPALARKVFTTFKSIIADAQAHGGIAHNPALSVKIGSAGRRKRKVTIPTKDEVRILLSKASGRWRPLIVAAVFTGLRASELRGLGWGDVDTKARAITVRRRADRWGKLGSPKTAESARTVPMTPMVVNALKAWRPDCPKGEHALVFPNGGGNVENLGNIANRGLGPLQIECGIVRPAQKGADGKPLPPRAKYGLHKLRHFYASWLIDQGFGPKRVQELMGHASIQMTFDTYGHLFPAPEADQERMAAGDLALVG